MNAAALCTAFALCTANSVHFIHLALTQLIFSHIFYMIFIAAIQNMVRKIDFLFSEGKGVRNFLSTRHDEKNNVDLMQFGHLCSVFQNLPFSCLFTFSLSLSLLSPFSSFLEYTTNQSSCLFRQPLVVMTISIESSTNWKLSTWTACVIAHTFYPIILQMNYEKFKLKSEIKLVKLAKNLVSCFCWHHRWLLHLKLINVR